MGALTYAKLLEHTSACVLTALSKKEAKHVTLPQETCVPSLPHPERFDPTIPISCDSALSTKPWGEYD